MESELQLKDLIAIFKRRYLYFVIPFVTLLIAAVLVSVLLPPVYQSLGLILIESPQISQTIVAGSIDSAARERISVIEQRVMTRTNLLSIAEKHKIFNEDERKDLTSTEIVQEMRDLAAVEFVTTGASRFRQTTIAFKVSFEHREARIAARVANELVTLFMNENVRSRTQIATETTEFLKQEAEKLERQLIEIEDRIATYKQENSTALPENLDLQIQIRERLQRQILNLGREVKGYEEELRFLDVQLRTAQVEASAVVQSRLPVQQPSLPQEVDKSVIGEYNRLRVALAEALATKAAKHPDVRALERELKAETARLKALGGLGATLVEIIGIESQISQFADTSDQNKLAEQETLRNRLEGLKAGLAVSVPTPLEEPRVDTTLQALNQLNVENIRTKTVVAQDRIDSLKVEKKGLDKRLADLEESILMTPQVDRALRGLERDYANAQNKYNEIRDKAMEAQIAENVEEASKSERFVLIEPPTVPDQPLKPNRPQLLAIGIAASFAAGIGALFGIEMIDGSIRGAQNLATLVNMMPLAVIPYIETHKEHRRRRTQLLVYAFVFVFGLILSLALVHFFYMPLDRIMYKVIDRFS